jgi:segregation and condensation protein A
VPYTVSTPVFEGPFDLLLHLITKQEVDLWEVSLVDIVDAYVATLVEMRSALDLEVATEFLLIASVLLELKARRLLPGRDDVELEEEFALWEERDLLLARLLECKTFKDAAAAMNRIMETAGRSWPRVAGIDERYVDLAPDMLAGVGAERLRDVMQALLAPKPPARVLLDHVAPVRASVADAVAELIDELPRVGRISFARLTSGLAERLEIIVRFLAILELYKQGAIDIDQVNSFAELEVVWVGSHAVSAGSVEEYQG